MVSIEKYSIRIYTMINETINELPKDTNDEVIIKRGRGRPRVVPKPKPIT